MNSDKLKPNLNTPTPVQAPKPRVKGSHRNKKPPKLTWI